MAHRPLMIAPFGIAMHHAPLAWITGAGEPMDLRLTYPPLATPGAPAPADNDAETGAESTTEKPAPAKRVPGERAPTKRSAAKGAATASRRTIRS